MGLLMPMENVAGNGIVCDWRKEGSQIDWASASKETTHAVVQPRMPIHQRMTYQATHTTARTSGRVLRGFSGSVMSASSTKTVRGTLV